LSRRLAREKAMQILFQIDVGNTDRDLAFQSVFDEKSLSNKDREYIKSLVDGICSSLDIIDQYIQSFAFDWNLERLANVDRNILRIAMYEMKFLANEIPRNVSINEAVELAKKFSTMESGKYVNGILDRFKKQLEQKAGE
jgi:N utilization substance protein B